MGMKGGERMVFIVTYRLKRKNARRKIAMKMDVFTQNQAIRDFKTFVELKNDSDKKQYELLTGDWKHIMYYERNEKYEDD